MGAGPTPLPPAVAAANAVIINHLGPTMNRVVEAVQDMARYAFQTRTERVLGIAGPASAGMEMALGNLVGAGSRVLSLVTGTFSGRLAEMARGVGASVDTVTAELGEPATLEALEAALAAGQYDLVTMVQGETSTGIYHPHIEAVSQRVRAHGALMMVDAVCTLTTVPLQMDDWDIDVVATGGQKGLASIPGVSLIAFSDRAWAVVEQRPRPIPHWCLDARRAWEFWGEHKYHYTAPVPGILAIHEALRLICEETLPVRLERHARCTRALQAAVQALGLELFAPEAWRLGSVLAICLPASVDSVELRRSMVERHGVEIAGAFGLDIFRIGQMGEQCRPETLFRTVHALGASLRSVGFDADVPAAMAALATGLATSAGGLEQ
jgi:aspartate aminotransferase-like enzyme